MSKRVVIVGGVAGGMSCAARIKRLDDNANVVVFEKGHDVSFANCGMPYYIGGVIPQREDLLVQTPETLHGRYGIDVRTRHEVVHIDRDQHRICVRHVETGKTTEEAYDILVLSPGAAPFRPPLPGVDGPQVLSLSSLEDMDRIADVAERSSHACVVGGGFIGLELVENLRERGVAVSLVEKLDQIMPPMDIEMTQPLIQELRIHGVSVYLGTTVERIEEGRVLLSNGEILDSDMVCLCVGVQPTTELARDAGLELGPRGHIRVDAHMRTSDPSIFALGDAVEVLNTITGKPDAVPLAGPANRQGRIAADCICGRDSTFLGVQATAIVKLFDLAAAQTGLSEKRVREEGWPYHRVYVHPMQHPRYYPGAQPVSTKLVFSPDGRIYGAQVVGTEGVEVMIDTLATAIRGGLTVRDLEHLELAYSPQWGNAKHGVNMVGFVATNVLDGDVETVEPESIPTEAFVLDVRMPDETKGGVIPGAMVIPLDELRTRIDELPKERQIAVYCAVGLRGYIAYRYLKQAGFSVRNVNGGYRTWTWTAAAHGIRKPAIPIINAATPDYSETAPHSH